MNSKRTVGFQIASVGIILVFVAAGIVFSLCQEKPETVTASLGTFFSGVGTLVLAILTIVKGPDVLKQFRLTEGSKLKFEAKRRSTRFAELTNIAFSRTLISEGEGQPNKTYYDIVMNRINEQKSVLNDFTEIWIDVESFFEEEKIKPYFQRMFEIYSDRKSALESWLILKDTTPTKALEHWKIAVYPESSSRMNSALEELKKALDRL